MTKQLFIDTETKETIEEHLQRITHPIAVRWALACAEHVIDHYEQKFPHDERPREAIKAGYAWLQGTMGIREARQASFAAHTAARQTDDKAATAAARAAGQAVATVHIFGHAIHASTYAVKTIAHATHFDTEAVANERAWQYKHLLDLEKEM
ncbi:hypothetical protein RRU94_06645 [Domibacillus sp. DTU_2020_1001157_1_SI_ALB_TIR_016]|uniref:putative immunity protein n=1 Tax=Domibacillus sp. DTU_2020_1001157_1_SI_ALB_TIR_016 TaxID=3077789 RepID=UPI0028EF4470|nr:hypothetical protein [Domibacillus sp. DTU_2020_1001157_1_SI_ALB_TIR_016]WNS78139.1 hypothetical protein RRU94_06645 [Domibacillus sp. DTU_2020_1001157_1_SI_ALB_TIR_016]